MADQQRPYDLGRSNPVRPPRPVSPMSPDTPSIPTWNEKTMAEQPVRTVIGPKEKPQERPRAAFWIKAKQAYTGRGGEKKHSRWKFWILLVVVVTALVLSTLILSILVNKENEKSGIITLRFNFTPDITDGLFPRDQTVAPRDVLRDADTLINQAKSAVGPAASQIMSVAESVASEVPDVVSKVKSAVDSAATHLQGAIEENMPKNVELGTRKFCVEFINDRKCKSLPLNLSDLLPDAVDDLPDTVENVIRDQVNYLQPFATALTNVAYIQITLIIGLVLVLIFAVVFVASMLSRLLGIVGCLVRLGYRSRILVHITLGVTCCLPLFIAAVILGILRQKASSLPAWVEVKHGEVGGLCFGALCCAIMLTFITAISPALIR